MADVVPEIETDRLLLRAHRLEDFPESAAIWANPSVCRFIGGTPSTEQQSWARMLGYRGHWSLMGFGYWAIEERSTRRFVGELGFADFKRDIDPSFRGHPEAGWALAPGAQGKGYAVEAIRAALQWGDARIDDERIVCLIHPSNRPSLHLARKFGFSLLRQASYRGADVNLFARDHA